MFTVYSAPDGLTLFNGLISKWEIKIHIIKLKSIKERFLILPLGGAKKKTCYYYTMFIWTLLNSHIFLSLSSLSVANQLFYRKGNTQKLF